MNISKKIMVLSLATLLTVSPIMANANSEKKVINVNSREEVLVEKDELESNPILVKDNEEEKIPEIRVIDMLEINNKEIKLEKEIYGNEEGVVMIPLRQITEELGYEVKWNNETRSVELTKGVQWTSLTVGEDSYNFAKMIIKLGAAPELKEATTFVPLTFLEEVLKVNINIREAGIINIVE